MRVGPGCLVVFLVACDSPADKCDDLVDVVCDRAVECVPSIAHSECVAEANAEIKCDAATGVTDGYSSCLSMVRNLGCDTLFPNDALVLPSECLDAILIGERRTRGPELPTSPMSSVLEVVDEIE